MYKRTTGAKSGSPLQFWIKGDDVFYGSNRRLSFIVSRHKAAWLYHQIEGQLHHPNRIKALQLVEAHGLKLDRIKGSDGSEWERILHPLEGEEVPMQTVLWETDGSPPPDEDENLTLAAIANYTFPWIGLGNPPNVRDLIDHFFVVDNVMAGRLRQQAVDLGWAQA